MPSSDAAEAQPWGMAQMGTESNILFVVVPIVACTIKFAAFHRRNSEPMFLRIEMMMSRRGTLATVLDWFLHSDENGQWHVTVSDVGDRIFSLPVDVPPEERAKPANMVARLWPKVLAEGVTFDFGSQEPTHIQAEIRRHKGPGYWPQAYGWLWQNEKVTVYRSHPVISSSSKHIDIASPDLIAKKCFEYAAELQAD